MPDFYSGNYFLNQSQMEVNAKYIYNYLSTASDPWTLEAISGLLGNTQTESTHNPGIWQNLAVDEGPGFGLTQWTPYTKYTNWCAEQGLDPSHMDSACKRLILESQSGGLQWVVHDNYPLTFKQYIKSKESPYYLGMTFLNNYEMPEVIDQPQRGRQAEEWYAFLSGEEPPGPGPDPGPDKNKYHRNGSILIPIISRRRNRNWRD